MPSLLTPTTTDLQMQRAELLKDLRFTEDELRQRAATYQLTVREADLLRQLDEIDYLLGE